MTIQPTDIIRQLVFFQVLTSNFRAKDLFSRSSAGCSKAESQYFKVIVTVSFKSSAQKQSQSNGKYYNYFLPALYVIFYTYKLNYYSSEPYSSNYRLHNTFSSWHLFCKQFLRMYFSLV